MMDNDELRRDFPYLQQVDSKGLSLAYLDNAATTQKPHQVIDAVRAYWQRGSANPHRGSYASGVRATEAFEAVRAKVARFIGASKSEEIAFTFGATDGLNQVAQSYAEQVVGEGDEILLSVAEHHSNLLPWQRVAARRNASLRYLPVDRNGCVRSEDLAQMLSSKTKILAITQVSNVLGGINEIRSIAAMAHEAGATVSLDATQSVPHIPVDVRDLDVDFMVFSGHKMLAPAGIGVLYGKKELLQSMEPARLGGGIVEEVSEQGVRLLASPLKFEAGTQNAEGVIGLGAAIDYLEAVGMERVRQIEHHLLEYALATLSGVPHIVLHGTTDTALRTGIISFDIAGVHPHDTATILASHSVAVRAGHHCAQPLLAHLGLKATCRMSLYFYNTEEEIDRLVDALFTVREVLGHGA